VSLGASRPVPHPKKAFDVTTAGKRRRRSPDEARVEIIESATKLLRHHGPKAVTLVGVAQDLRMNHSTILYHFGSIEALHQALMDAIVQDLAHALQNVVAELSANADGLRALVDIVFDAFGKGGVAQLAAWITLSGAQQPVEQIRGAISELVLALERHFSKGGEDARDRVTSAVMFVALMASGYSVIGGPLSDALDREHSLGRKIAASLLSGFLAAG
jgi:AcrR family transcriptional regulator